MKKRIFRYDNIKAVLMFLVVAGHMLSYYVSDSWQVRWLTVWIYSFHMPAFVMVSGILHKRYISEKQAADGVKGETRLRLDKIIGYILCGYALKILLYYSRMLIWPDPPWYWFTEHAIPWYLFVMAEYELIFWLIGRVDGKVKPWVVIAVSFAVSAASGYFDLPEGGDFLCLMRMLNFLPLYAIGYYLDMRTFNEWLERRWIKIAGWAVMVISLIGCANASWSVYSWRKWFTGSRSYEFLQDFFSFAVRDGWWVRLAVWAFALIMSLAFMAVIPDRDLGRFTVTGQRTLGIYFWHKPVQYFLKMGNVLPRLVVMFGGTYNAAVAGTIHGLAFGGGRLAMAAGLAAYLVICAIITWFFSLKIFEHPCSDLMKLGSRISGR